MSDLFSTVTELAHAGSDAPPQHLVLGAAALLLIVLALRTVARRPSRRWRGPRFRRRSGHVVPLHTSRAPLSPAEQKAHGLLDPADQLRAIAAMAFETKPLLNREEYRLLPLLEAAVREAGRGHRLMAQTSMGEILRPLPTCGTDDARRAAFNAINAKRLDFSVFDRTGHLVLAIEYQGTGHYQNAAFLRDAIKREVVRRAGVPYLEVAPDFCPDTLLRQVTTHLRPRAQAANGH